jgi:hypothetical protein
LNVNSSAPWASFAENVSMVAALLGISKFSIYNYLNDMRSEAVSPETARL